MLSTLLTASSWSFNFLLHCALGTLGLQWLPSAFCPLPSWTHLFSDSSVQLFPCLGTSLWVPYPLSDFLTLDLKLKSPHLL